MRRLIIESNWLGRKRDKWILAARAGAGTLFDVHQGSSKSLLAFMGLLLCGIWQTGVGGMCQVAEKVAATPLQHLEGNPVLIELFTSEGCSSCPLADEFVQKLDKLQPVADAQLIVLSEHVDYFDHDGWKDPNSSSALTDRQAAYERVLGLSASYTPQIIVDGAGEMRLADPQQTEKVLQQAAATPKVPVRLERVSVDSANPGLLRAHVVADGSTSRHNADVYLAVALDHADSQVLRGENGGRHLAHTAVVQQLVKIGKFEKGQGFVQDVQVKLKPGIDPDNLRVIAFIQTPGPGKLLGAALWKAVH
jgi:hypothetical protein